MKKFFQMSLVILVAMCSGCVTHYRTMHAEYTRSEAYYPGLVYGPTIERTYYVRPDFGRWHNIESPLRDEHHHDGGHRDGYGGSYQSYQSYQSGGYNNGSPVYVTPAPSSRALRGMIPR